MVSGERVARGEESVSGAPHTSAHCSAAQFESDLVHHFPQVFLSFVQALHLCKSTTAGKSLTEFEIITYQSLPKVKFGGWKWMHRSPVKIGDDFPSGPSKPRTANS